MRKKIFFSNRFYNRNNYINIINRNISCNILKIIFTIIILQHSEYIYSQQKNDTLDIFDAYSLEDLINIEIKSASNISFDIKKQPVSVTTITSKQLELSGARTIIDAIMIYVPGFFVIEDQDDVIAGFRGLGPDNNSKVMLLLNGQNFNTEWFWGPPSAILNSNNYDYIDRIEVIRGPGSVTLGQGALLGIINIVTKSGKKITDKAYENTNNENEITSEGYASIITGKNDLFGGNIEGYISENKIKSYFQISQIKYRGQELRNDGYSLTKNEGFKKETLSEIGLKLKRSEDFSIVGNVEYKRLQFNLQYFDHTQDLYNFRRDRNKISQNIVNIGTNYEYDITSNLSIKTEAHATTDNFRLTSIEGYTMGGTREDRYGFKSIFNINNLIKNNKLALCFEYLRYEYGKKNLYNNNFIANSIDTNTIFHNSDFLKSANINRIWGYPDNINVLSFVCEDYYKIGLIDLFGALRYDKHPYWGNNISPRLGLIFNNIENMHIRLSYQSGYRGAVGVHYSGGYRQDGFLSAKNFDKIEQAQIKIFENGIFNGNYEKNLSSVKAETMHSFEFSFDYDLNKNINLNFVSFYNKIENVIDVGVIWRDTLYSLPNVGSDIKGDWNGYWFFKNTKGSIDQAGSEISIKYQNEKIIANISHSLVKLIKASDQQKGSMYVTTDKNIKAYPENVTRVNLVTFLTEKISLGANYLYYYSWYSPRDQKISGNHMLNFVSSVDISDKLSTTFSIINLLGNTKLYPMNSNANDPSLSDGTPTYESTTFWVKLKYKF